MPTYLYCIRSDPQAVPPDLTGVDGAEVRSLSATGLTAWVSDVDEVPVSSTLARVKAHDAVCAAAMGSGETPLPIRFGQTFTDDAAAATAIAGRRPTLRERLARVAGCVEVRVVVSRGREAQEPATPMSGVAPVAADDRPAARRGTEFLRRLAREGRADLAREVACEELRHAVREAARPFIVEHQRCEAARGVAFFPLLVRRSELEASQAVIAACLAAVGGEASLLGPFPPYSFSGDA
ncbi:MAG TPA: GvpL/GvpF family gas vesicle protein [Gemmatimonadaceae bacterium]|nr:GvpL/GvpF family gas vesicle protein [Gemmatimonadaceae bacterium]